MDFKKRINKAFDDVDKILQDGTNLPAKIRVSLRHALENLATACTSYDDYDRGYLPNSRKPIKSDFDDNGNWVDDEKPVKKEDMHGSFRKLSKEEHDELKPQVEEELDRWMSKKHFGLDKEVYDETVEYIISLFGEDNYAPRDVKEAVSSWYNDTLDSFPEMLQGKGNKRKIASAAYLKQLKSSHCIKSSRKPIKSSKIKDGDKITPEMAEKFTGYVTAFEPLNVTYSYDLRRMVIEKGIGVSFTNGPGGYMFIIDPNRLEEFYDCLKRTCRNFDKNLIERNISKYDTHDFIGCRIYY